MFKIENEHDLQIEVVQYIRRFYPEAILVAWLGELQDTSFKRIDSWKKGYMAGQPDIMFMNYFDYYAGCCIEFKSPNCQISEAQKKMKHKYKQNITTSP